MWPMVVQVLVLVMCLMQIQTTQQKPDKYGIDPAELPLLNATTTINFEVNSMTRCDPAESCDGIDIKTIPFITGSHYNW